MAPDARLSEARHQLAQRAPYRHAPELKAIALCREAVVCVVDGAEVPVGERVVVGVEREVGLDRDLEVRPVSTVAYDDDERVAVLSVCRAPEKRYIERVPRAMGQLSPKRLRSGSRGLHRSLLLRLSTNCQNEGWRSKTNAASVEARASHWPCDPPGHRHTRWSRTGAR